MPLHTRLFVKTALVYLVVSLTLGLLLVVPQGRLPLPSWLALLTPVYFHLFMVGWVMQLIVGVALWMFPKYSRSRPRGSTALVWVTYGGLNGGLLLRALAEPAQAQMSGLGWGGALALAALLQWLGGMAFIANTWPRVKEK